MRKKSQYRPYRLGLTLGVQAKSTNPNSHAYDGFLGWAMIAANEGHATEVPIQPEDTAEIRVVDYACPDDMLEPMSLAAYAQRLEAVTAAHVAAGAVIVKVAFDKMDYQAFLHRACREDNHQARAAWAAQK